MQSHFTALDLKDPVRHPLEYYTNTGITSGAWGRGDEPRDRGAAGDERPAGSVMERLLRELAPQVLGTLVRRHGQFDACEDAVQEALLAASLHPPTAYSASGDPPSGSPAGAVYQLPLEQGRSDAAPKGNGGTGAEAVGGAGAGAGGSGEASESGSLYRSENNFGSSSRVPGVAADGASVSSSGKASGASGAGDQSAGGGGGAVSAAIPGGIIAAETTDTGNTSIPASIVLLGAIALLAVAVGILSRRFARR